MMEKLKEKLKYGKRGITLIALVVTIVVLLILAGVTINLLLSDTGLLNKVQQAKNTWENAEQSDINAIGELTKELDEMLNGIGAGGTPDESEDTSTLKQLIDAGTIVADRTEVQDKYGNPVVVPKGFKVTDEATTVPEGIVIEDGTGTETTTGNQFVWIPVGTVYKNTEKTETSTIQLGRYTFDSDSSNDIPDGTPILVQLAYTAENPTNYVVTTKEEAESKNVVIDSYYFELSTSRPGVASDELDGENATAKNLAEFVQSVKDNGGYYLARYEASYGSGYNSEGVDDAERYANAKPLSKISTDKSTSSMNYVEGTLWNYITQLNASKVCQNMYANNNTVGTESDLVNSYAWDTAIVFIQSMDTENSNYANKIDGNGTLKNTGITGDEVCNIFDMAENVSEWTTEYCTYDDNITTYPCTYRGGVCTSSINYTAYRGAYEEVVEHYSLSFRVLLYVK